VMLVPAHGMSRSSYNQTFIEGVEPRYAVFSTGDPEIKGGLSKKLESNLKTNWKKYKNDPTIERLFRTDEDNAVVFYSNGRDIKTRTWGKRNEQTGGGSGSFLEQRF